GTLFIVYHIDPTAPKSSAKGDQPALDEPDGDFAPLARVETDEMTITGKVIGLDQATDMAWVDGRGTLTQLAASGLLSDKGLANPPAAGNQDQNPARARPAAPAKKTPMTISFAEGMKFFGQPLNQPTRPNALPEFLARMFSRPTDPQDCPAARAEF